MLTRAVFDFPVASYSFSRCLTSLGPELKYLQFYLAFLLSVLPSPVHRYSYVIFRHTVCVHAFTVYRNRERVNIAHPFMRDVDSVVTKLRVSLGI